MPSLLETLKSNVHWLVLVLLEASSLTMLFRLSPYHQSVWFDHITQVAGFIAEQRQQLAYYSKLKEENRRLTHRNIILQQNLQTLRSDIKRLKHQPTATEKELARRTAELKLIPAIVCDNSISRRDNVILINKGSADGVRAEQGVLSGTGIVGIVSQVSRHYATVVSILNSKSSVSCRIRSSEYFGYLHWDGGNPMVATLDDVPAHAHVKVGDTVETSGFSNIFPNGIFVGKVTKTGFSADGQSLKLSVQLSTDMACLGVVMVAADPDAEDIKDTTEQL